MSGEYLVWSNETRRRVRIVFPAGRVDEPRASSFFERLAVEIEGAVADGASRLVIDLSSIEYMSSRGLRSLTLAQRKADEAGLAIVLAGPNEIMREILAISRYDKVFEVFDSVDQVVID